MAERFVFEKAIKRLEDIVMQLEKGDAPLDQSLAIFEEGTALIRQCECALDQAEQTVRQLVKTPDGPQAVPFEESEL